jgi:hypothetical protein
MKMEQIEVNLMFSFGMRILACKLVSEELLDLYLTKILQNFSMKISLFFTNGKTLTSQCLNLSYTIFTPLMSPLSKYVLKMKKND